MSEDLKPYKVSIVYDIEMVTYDNKHMVFHNVNNISINDKDIEFNVYGVDNTNGYKLMYESFLELNIKKGVYKYDNIIEENENWIG